MIQLGRKTALRCEFLAVAQEGQTVQLHLLTSRSADLSCIMSRSLMTGPTGCCNMHRPRVETRCLAGMLPYVTMLDRVELHRQCRGSGAHGPGQPMVSSSHQELLWTIAAALMAIRNGPQTFSQATLPCHVLLAYYTRLVFDAAK